MQFVYRFFSQQDKNIDKFDSMDQAIIAGDLEYIKQYSHDNRRPFSPASIALATINEQLQVFKHLHLELNIPITPDLYLISTNKNNFEFVKFIIDKSQKDWNWHVSGICTIEMLDFIIENMNCEYSTMAGRLFQHNGRLNLIYHCLNNADKLSVDCLSGAIHHARITDDYELACAIFTTYWSKFIHEQKRNSKINLKEVCTEPCYRDGHAVNKDTGIVQIFLRYAILNDGKESKYQKDLDNCIKMN